MLRNFTNSDDLKDVLLSLMSTSGTLTGISLALVGITNYKITSSKISSIADDMFLFSSLGFLSVCYLSFFALRHVRSLKAAFLVRLIDVIFLSSLTLLTISGFVTVYELM